LEEAEDMPTREMKKFTQSEEKVEPQLSGETVELKSAEEGIASAIGYGDKIKGHIDHIGKEEK
jgi:hypothetical protein